MLAAKYIIRLDREILMMFAPDAWELVYLFFGVLLNFVKLVWTRINSENFILKSNHALFSSVIKYSNYIQNFY